MSSSYRHSASQVEQESMARERADHVSSALEDFLARVGPEREGERRRPG